MSLHYDIECDELYLAGLEKGIQKACKNINRIRCSAC